MLTESHHHTTRNRNDPTIVKSQPEKIETSQNRNRENKISKPSSSVGARTQIKPSGKKIKQRKTTNQTRTAFYGTATLQRQVQQ